MTNTPPSLRLFELLETMCARGQPLSLGDAIEATGWPKPMPRAVSSENYDG